MIRWEEPGKDMGTIGFNIEEKAISLGLSGYRE